MTRPALVAAALAASTPAAVAQGLLPLVPFSQTDDLYVNDTSNDTVWRLVDLDLDGDYDAPGEVTAFYNDAVGPIALTNNNGIAVGGNGTVYVSDSGQDIVMALEDLNGDGDCHDLGEARVFYDGNGGAASGVFAGSPANLTVDLVGNVWLAVSGSGSSAPDNVDKIIRLTDNDFNGDANGIGEAVEYYLPVPGGSGGETLPQDVAIGPDGRVYIVDIPSSGSLPKGVYRLDDIDSSGLIDAPGEAEPFFVPTPQGSTPFYWGFTIDRDGYFYMADTNNELVWRFRDEDGNGTVDPVTEATIWWQTSGSSLIWRLAAASDGSILAAESQSPDRILRLVDSNGDGTVDPLTETFTLWDDTLGDPNAGDPNIGNPRSLALGRRPTVEVDSAPTLGTTLLINTFAKTGDAVQLFFSGTTVPPVALAPFGLLEIASFAPLAVGTVPVFGPFATTVALPADPGLAGLTLHIQGLAGKGGDLRLTNLSSLTLQP